MGQNESKAQSSTVSDILSFKNALIRLDGAEIKMLERAGRKFGDGDNFIEKHTFMRCALGILPYKYQQRVYEVFGGSKSKIAFQDLVCGLTVLLKGTVDERKKFIFALYDCCDNGNISLADMLSLLSNTDDKECVMQAFKKKKFLTFDSFDKWMMQNPRATGWIAWSLYPPSEHFEKSVIPVDIEMLTKISHLTKSEAELLEKRYHELKNKFANKGNKFTAKALRRLACPPLTPPILKRLCQVWGEGRCEEVGFREVLLGVSTTCLGDKQEFLTFSFKFFDVGDKGKLSERDLDTMMEMLESVRLGPSARSRVTRSRVSGLHPRSMSMCSITSKEEFEGQDDIDVESESTDSDPEAETTTTTMGGGDGGGGDDVKNTAAQPERVIVLTQSLREAIDDQHKQARRDDDDDDVVVLNDGDVNCLAMPAFKKWALENDNLIKPFRDAFANLGHTVFALRPKTPALEGKMVQQRLKDDYLRGVTRKHGTMCNLVAASWYQSWKHYAGIDDTSSLANVTTTSFTRKIGDKHNGGPPHPSKIDNFSLFRGSSETERNDRGVKQKPEAKLKLGLLQDKDYVVLSDVVWSMLHNWYGGDPVVIRPVIAYPDEEPSIELYPLSIKVMHYPSSKTQQFLEKREISGMTGSNSGKETAMKLPTTSHLVTVECSRAQTVRSLEKEICSRQRYLRKGNPKLKSNAIRLWLFDDPTNPQRLESDAKMGEFHGMVTVLLEVRNDDHSWPSELFTLAKSKRGKGPVEMIFGDRSPRELGATGLSNLGNTCFLNAALQCMSNTQVLRHYFRSNWYLKEINEANTMGMKGAIAKSYGDLVKRLWCGKSSLAPSELRSVIVKHNSSFKGYLQHDSQELLACLLDGLHEDLNRVKTPPYVERKDSDGRPDCVVAKESWDGHLKRSQSIIVDLFHGQLKSTLRCKTCKFESISFDPFSCLTLPLPTDDTTVIDVKYTRLTGVPPEICAVRVRKGATFKDIKAALGKTLADCNPRALVFVECPGHAEQTVIRNDTKIRSLRGSLLNAYETDVQTLFVSHSHSTVSSRQTSEQSDVTSLHSNVEASSARSSVSESVVSETPHTESTSVSEGNATTTTSYNSNYSSYGTTNPNIPSFQPIDGHCFAVHRRKESFHTHFLTETTKTTLFGSPILVPRAQTTTNKQLYDCVWRNVRRSVLPEFRERVDGGECRMPFQLTQLTKTATACSKCDWARFCNGCVIPNSDDVYTGNATLFGIDWFPNELCLYYDIHQEMATTKHPSVDEIKNKDNEPFELTEVLEAFTKEEDMGKDDTWYCSKCKTHREATKKLDIWSLPPVLVIHLKRFRMSNARWIKSQRRVIFPIEGFDVYKSLTPPTFEEHNDVDSDDEADDNGSDKPSENDPDSNSNSNTNPDPDHVNENENKNGNDNDNNHNNDSDHNRNNDDDDDDKDSIADSDHTAVASEHNNVVINSVDDDETVVAASDDGTTTATDLVEYLEINGAGTISVVSDATPQPSSANTRTSTPVPPDDQHVSVDEDEDEHTPSKDKKDKVVDEDDFEGFTLVENIEKLDPHAKFYKDPKCPRVYDLTSMTIHLGIMGGGHYVSYGKNPNSNWYYYNDSSCKQMPKERVEKEHGYCLFYTARGIDPKAFFPKGADVNSIDPEEPDQVDETDDSATRKEHCIVS